MSWKLVARLRRLTPMLAVGFCLAAAPVTAGEVPLVVKGRAPDAAWPVPVRCGVPFLKGVLKPGRPVAVVDDANAAQVAQTLVTATWDPKGEAGVRWLLVDFCAAAGRSYRLLFGDDVKSGGPRAAPLATETGDAFAIDTGALRTRCSRRRFDLFGSLARVDAAGAGVPIMAAGVWTGPYIEHEKRGLFRADLDSDASIVLEENGPVRAVLKADGWYTNDRGERFCRFTIRAHFVRGKADTRLEHTFIFTGHSLQDRLCDIGISLPLSGAPAPGASCVFSAQESDDATAAAFTANGPAHVCQVMDSPNHHDLGWEVTDLLANRVVAGGRKTGGWMWTRTDSVSALTAVHEAWQQYPIEFEWERTAARLHLWPRHGRAWDTSFDGFWHYMTDAQKQYMIAEKAKIQGAAPAALGAKLRASDAVGAAKTHEVWLCFGSWQDAAGCAAYADALTLNPVFAYADLQWQTRTRALDWLPHHPYDATAFPDEEGYLAGILELMRLHSDVVHYYGWWDWGGYHEGVTVDPSRKPRRPADTFEPWRVEPVWHRAKPKSHYYLGSFPWTMYYRTGLASWLRYAQRYTLYSAERLHTHHTDPSVNRLAGEEYHYDNSEIHWLGGGRGDPNRTMTLNPLLDKHDSVYAYWLAGDRRPLDVLLMWGQMFKGLMAKDDSLLKRCEQGGPFGGYHRSTGQFLNRLCVLYEATWDEAYLRHATRLASLFRGVDAHVSLRTARPGETPRDETYVWYAGWLYEGLWRYYHVTGDEAVKAALLSYCRATSDLTGGFVAGGSDNGNMRWCAYGYDLTGEGLFLDLGRHMLDREVREWVSAESLGPGTRKFRSLSMPYFMGVAGAAPDAWREGRLPTDRKGLSIDYLVVHPDLGEGLRPIYLLEEQDREWRIHFAAHQTGVFAVFDPAGKAVSTVSLDWRRSVRGQIVVPRDGMTGTYSLVCLKLNPTAWGAPNQVPGEYPAWVSVIECDLRKIAYPVASTPGRPMGFDARAWFFLAPANAGEVEALWQPAPQEAGGQRHFVIQEVDGPYRATTETTPAENTGVAGETAVHRFRIPPAPKDRVFWCRPACEPGRLLTRAVPNAGRRFVIRGAPACVSASPEACFAPSPPREYRLP